MSAPIQCLDMNHINVVVEDFEASVEHFVDLYGAQHLLDLQADNWRACLISIGTVIVELFVPNNYLLNARFGPHYFGVEYQITDMDEARKLVAEWGIRIVSDIGVAFDTHPADTFGVAFCPYHRSFHEEDAVSAPPYPTLPIPAELYYREPMKPVEYWREEHPLGCTGVKRLSIAVSDLNGASRFFQEFLGATVLYDEPRPAVLARGVGLQLGDTIAELMTPTDDGPLGRYLARYGDGIRSTVFQVADLQRAHDYFVDRGVTPRPGDAPGTFAIPPEANRGILFEFSD